MLSALHDVGNGLSPCIGELVGVCVVSTPWNKCWSVTEPVSKKWSVRPGGDTIRRFNSGRRCAAIFSQVECVDRRERSYRGPGLRIRSLGYDMG